MEIKRIVLDVLKPHQPPIIEYGEKIASLEGVDGATLTVVEVDDRTQTVKVVVEGESLSFEVLKETIDELGGSVHSVDQVSAGKNIVKTTI